MNDSADTGPSNNKSSAAIQWITAAADGIKWLTDRIIGFLKLTVTIAFMALLVTVVYYAIRNADTYAVKPFAVPAKMELAHEESGRILANLLKQSLKDEENRINNNITDKQISSEQIRITAPRNESNTEDNPLNSSINEMTIPETGITINDVIEFISVIFGRKNVIGTVYTDQDEIYLQLEFKGKIYELQRKMDKETKTMMDPNQKTSGISREQLNDMIGESSKRILSLVADKYRLYYFCMDGLTQLDRKTRKSQYSELYESCSIVNDEKAVNKDKLANLKSKLDNEASRLSSIDPMAAYIVMFLNGRLAELTDIHTASSSEITTPAEPLTPDSLTEALVETEPSSSQDDDSGEEETYESAESIRELARCTNRNPPDTRLSNNFEAHATRLYKEGKYTEACRDYLNAIRVNCDNQFAWANLGLMLIDPENDEKLNIKEGNIEGGNIALEKATRLDTSSGWMWHSRCVAEAYLKGTMEDEILGESCLEARKLQPEKKYLYDKLFYTAIADMYKKVNRPEEAKELYRRALNIDNKRTCHMLKIIGSLHEMKYKDDVREILENSYTVEENESECEPTLKAIAENLFDLNL